MRHDKKRTIDYYQSKYPDTLRKLAMEAGMNLSAAKQADFLKTVNEHMWLIECEETKNSHQPYCLYYHESGNVYGFTSFRSEETFLVSCRTLLKNVWGIAS